MFLDVSREGADEDDLDEPLGPFDVTQKFIEDNGWEHVYPGYAGTEGSYLRGGTPGGW